MMLGMDENYMQRRKTITLQLEQIKMPDARNIAKMIVDYDGSKEQLSQTECRAAKFIMNFIDVNDKALNHFALAEAICSDYNEMKKFFLALCRLGYTREELFKFYKRNPGTFCYSLAQLKRKLVYLKKIGFHSAQIKELLLSVIVIGYAEATARCEAVLTYFDTDLLYELGKGFLFYPYYTDPIDCLEYIVQRLGVNGAERILKNESMLLFLWKESYNRNDQTHGAQHREALALIEKYAQNTDS